jgi:hypothetical protein
MGVLSMVKYNRISKTKSKFYKPIKCVLLVLVFMYLQACTLAANEVNPDPGSLTTAGVCGMRFVKVCDTLTPIYDDGTGVPTLNVSCLGQTLEATCTELIIDDGEGPFSLWAPTSVTCPAGYQAMKVGSPTAVNNVNFTCFKE